MNNSLRYLTKSRFQLALECPTKLYYYGKSEYPSIREEDEFLAGPGRGRVPGGRPGQTRWLYRQNLDALPERRGVSGLGDGEGFA